MPVRAAARCRGMGRYTMPACWLARSGRCDPDRLRAHPVGYGAGMEEQRTDQPEATPHDDELDVEAPNESAPGHHPPEEDSDE